MLDLVQQQGAKKRRLARVTAYTVNATGLLVMVARVRVDRVHPDRRRDRGRRRHQRRRAEVLEALFGDEALRQLARTARQDLLDRVRALLDSEAARSPAYGRRSASIPDLPERLRIAAQSVRTPGAGHPSALPLPDAARPGLVTDRRSAVAADVPQWRPA